MILKTAARCLVAVILPCLLATPLAADAKARPAKPAKPAKPPKPVTPTTISGTVRHSVLAASYAKGKVYVISAEGKIEWEYPAKNVQDVWALGKDMILFSHRTGATIVNRDKKVIWDFKAEPEVHSAQPLPGRRVLISLSGQSKAIEVDSKGKVVKTVTVKSERHGDRHMQMRHSRRTKDGTYLIVLTKEQVIHEVDADSKLLRVIKAPKGFSFDHVSNVARLANGNTLVGTGAGKAAVEIDKDGKVVWSIAEGDIPDVKLTYVATAERLANGNTLLTCYKGTYQFLEVSKDKKIVWGMYVEGLSGIAASHLLDQKGPAYK